MNQQINKLQDEIAELTNNKLIFGKTYDPIVWKEIQSKKKQILELHEEQLKSLCKNPSKSLYRVTE